ncbi:MAG: DUF6516 family protein [Candidatus Vecturithrix sp.]|jgi:hypothetical protein|nr:DUF6516 family protein [Candidatus Vecturithrix sp.]
MFIEAYFETLQPLIRDCGYIQSTTITTDKRSDYVGFFKADLYFIDGSVLFVREFVFTKTELMKDMYAYHYQDAQGQIIFRYDNTRHFPQFPTFPHHKHLASEVLAAREVDLQQVIQEIVERL